MSKEKLFNESCAALDAKIAQHRMGIRFNAYQMQTIRVAMANINFAALDLGGEYLDIAKNYNSDFLSIEIANQHNSDRGAYIRGDISPKRLSESRAKMGHPLVLGIVKPNKSIQITRPMALYAYQQHMQQQHQQNMAKLTAGLEKVAISSQENNHNSVADLTASLEQTSISQPSNNNNGIGNRY